MAPYFQPNGCVIFEYSLTHPPRSVDQRSPEQGAYDCLSGDGPTVLHVFVHLYFPPLIIVSSVRSTVLCRRCLSPSRSATALCDLILFCSASLAFAAIHACTALREKTTR